MDLIITDMLMRDADGVDVIAKLSKELAHVRIIVMAGALGGDFMNAARKTGASDALLKPFEPAELVQAVRRVIG